MLQGSSPIRLSQLDISPALEAGALEQQAIVNLSNSVNQAVQNFQAKQQEKEQKKMTANALRQFIPGLGEEVYGAIAKDPQILKSMSDLTNIQAKQQEQEILGQKMAKREEQESILKQAIGVNTTPEGTIDTVGVRQSFIDLGGTDESILGELFTGQDYRLDQETGIVFVDGQPKFNVGKAFVEPTESEKAKSKAELDKLEAEINRLNAQAELYRSQIETTPDSFGNVSIIGIDGKPIN